MNLNTKNIRKILLTFFFFSFVLIIINTASAATPLYVNGSSGNDSWDGTSPTHTSGNIGPMKTIQIAINSLSTGGTVNVASGTYYEHLLIGKSLTLMGENRETTIIDGLDNGRPLTINLGAVNLSNLTIRNGSDDFGGGIYSTGDLQLDNCRITGNNADYGGGVYLKSGSGYITNSIIIGNHARNGGGINIGNYDGTYGLTEAYLTMYYCLISGNHANIANDVYCENGFLNADKNYWGQNQILSGQIEINQEANEDPFPFTFAQFQITSIIYMTLQADPNLLGPGCSSQITANFNNLNTGGTITPTDPAQGHIPDGCMVNFTTNLGSVNSSATTSNGTAVTSFTAGDTLGTANILALMDYPISQTSIVIRVYYVNGTTGNDSWDGSSPTHTTGNIGPMKTVQAAINAVNTGGTIRIAEGTYFEHIIINKALNLLGDTRDTTVIDGNSNGRSIYVGNISKVKLSNLTITHGSAYDGGGIYSLGTLEMTNCRISGNIATIGGGIYAQGNTNIKSCIISGNYAIYNAGGIYYYKNNLTINYCQFKDNNSYYSLGNDVYQDAGSVDARYNWWGQNTGPIAGQIFGAVNYSPWLYMTLTANPTVIGLNDSSQVTADFNNTYNGTTITPINPLTGHIPDGCMVNFTTDLGNITSSGQTAGGLISVPMNPEETAGTANINAQADNQISNTQVIIVPSIIHVNGTTGNDSWDGSSPTHTTGNIGPMKTIQAAINAVNIGGMIYIAAGSYLEYLHIDKELNLIGSNRDTTIIDGNGSGRPITISSTAVLVNISNLTIRNGLEYEGGGIYSEAPLNLTNCKISDNGAYGFGGGIKASNTTNINNCILNNNSSTYGGGIYATDNTSITNSIITGNYADYGGGIYYAFKNLTVQYCILSGNYSSPVYGYGSSIYKASGDVNAALNWWGQNTGPTDRQIDGLINYTPWLSMVLTANPSDIGNGESSQITADFNYSYDGIEYRPINPSDGHILDGQTVHFSTNLGNITSQSNTSNGKAVVVLNADETGIAQVSAQYDNQTSNTDVRIRPSECYVDAVYGDDNYDGSSPKYLGGLVGPKKHIQTAIFTICSGGTVYVASGTYNEQIEINRSLKLIGENRDNTIIDVLNIGRPITINFTASPSYIYNFTLTNGNTSTGGGIYSEATVTIKNCRITRNAATVGGAVFTTGDMYLSECIISENLAEAGAGIYVDQNKLTINYSQITNNTASNGSGIFVSHSGGSVDARYNWWGQNSGPDYGQCVGTGNYSPWLYMKLTSEPPVIYYNNTSDITADFNNSFNEIEINSLDPLMGHLPDGCTVNFTTTIGTLENININTLNGLAITKFIGNEVGNAAITAILNNQVLNTSVVVVDNIPPTASANPKGGIFNTDKTVTLLMDENGSIYYTLDGSTPSKSSLLYSDPIIINNSTILKFIAYDLAGNASTVYNEYYEIDNIPPSVNASVPGGYYNSSKTVYLNLSETSGTIYYTLDGSLPTFESDIYTDPLEISSSTILKFLGVDRAGNFSPIYSEDYVIDLDNPVGKNNLSSGYYNSPITVILRLDEPGNIYYTIDGSTPTTSSYLYVNPLVIGVTTNLKFIGVDLAGNYSPIYSENYVIDLINPVVTNNLASGYYNTSKTVNLSLSEPGAIYYTIDGSTPTTSSYLYVNPLVIAITTNLKFIGVDLAGNSSPIYSEDYVIDMVNPTASGDLASGYYNTSKTVILSLSEPGAIYYTTDGTTPTTSSSLYVNPLVIGVTTNLKFIGVDLAGNSSPVRSKLYTIDKVAPLVSYTTPANSGTGFSRTAKIVVKFNDKIKNSTNYTKITVKNLTTGKTVSITMRISTTLLYITTGLKRTANTWYQVTIPAKAIKDLAGNNLAKDYTFKFKTGSA